MFPREFVSELNTTNLGNSPSFLTITHMTLSTKRFQSYRISTINIAAAAERIFTFPSRIGRNSRSPEYRFGWQLSQLSNGPSNGSKRLVICELRQLETWPVTESPFLADHTFLYKIGFWQNFVMTSPETSYTKNVTNELSFLLVTHTTHFDIRFGCYSALKIYFSSVQVTDRLDCMRLVRFWGPQDGWDSLRSEYQFWRFSGCWYPIKEI
jgi:hypothetical protein